MERDAPSSFILPIIIYFNSHAHVERDGCARLLQIYQESFQLTRSRGAWQLTLLSPFRPLSFQLTRSRGAWLTLELFVNLPRIFQLTRSRGAWLKCGAFLSLFYISTHTLTWSVTLQTSLANVIFTFQLTRSRGAWQLAMFSVVDLFVISTHTLTWSVT